jgi:hypothetical protein
MFGMHLLPGWSLLNWAPSDSDRSGFKEIWNDNRDLTICRTEELEPVRYRVNFADLVSVEIDPRARTIAWVAGLPKVPRATLEHFLADQIAPRILAHEGENVIHAGAVYVEQGALLLIGDSGSGKSTLAASFHHSGNALMGDDAIILANSQNGVMARPVYPSLRLFSDSLEYLFRQPVAAREMAHYSAKQRVNLAIAADARELGRPVKGLFLLAEPEGEIIAVRRLQSAEACMILIRNSFALDPSDPDLARQRMDRASRFVGKVPTFSVSYPRDYCRLSDVREAITSANPALAE